MTRKVLVLLFALLMHRRPPADNRRMPRSSHSALVVVVASLALAPVASSASGETRRCPPSGASTLAVVECSDAPVVASLDPRYRTGKTRFRLSAGRTSPEPCRASEFVFYA